MPKLGAILFLGLTVILAVISVELFYIARAARDVSSLLRAPVTVGQPAAPLTEMQQRQQMKREMDTMTDRLNWLLNERLNDATRQQPTRRPTVEKAPSQ